MLAQAAAEGLSVLDETLTQTLAALKPAGKRVVQIGCNNGRELLSTRSLGAKPALGIDQSEGFLQQVRLLSEAAGIAGTDCQFLCQDIYSLPADTPSLPPKPVDS